MFPLLSDFHPHGKVCGQYGVLTDEGYSNRVVFIIDANGVIRHREDYGLENLPDNDIAFEQLAALK